MKFHQSKLISFLVIIFGNLFLYTPEVISQPLKMTSVVNVHQLRDVTPNDWAYQALKNLVERYHCIAGDLDLTYDGERSLTRYEFAAGLNACLRSLEQLIAEGEQIVQTDIETLQRLTQEFEAEINVLNTRIDQLENSVAFLEDNQFSTTTKLTGEAVFSLTQALGDKQANSNQDLPTETVFDNRVRLSFNTSFTGKDLLQVRLDALNATAFGPPITGTQMTRLPFDVNTNNEVEIGRLFYRFPVGKKLKIIVDATGARYNANFFNFNRFFAHPLTGSISRFGRFNPIYYQGILGAGISATYDFNNSLNLSVGYLARQPNQPSSSAGLFNGSYAALAQLGIKPIDKVDLGLTYVRAYYAAEQAFVSGATGSRLANNPFSSLPTSADHFGFQSNFRITPKFNISGWVGWTQAYAESSGNNLANSVSKGDQANILNWAIAFAFLDLGKEGSVTGLIIGQPPKVTTNEGGETDPDSAWHIQAQYRYPITDNIELNPGVFVILNPENNSDNPAIWIATMRTVFTF